MTGEMGHIDRNGYDPLNRETWPVHAAIAKAIRGATLRPFDVYQGPYIQTRAGAIWVHCAPEDECTGRVYLECGAQPITRDFFPAWDERAAIHAAHLAMRAAKHRHG